MKINLLIAFFSLFFSATAQMQKDLNHMLTPQLQSGNMVNVAQIPRLKGSGIVSSPMQCQKGKLFFSAKPKDSDYYTIWSMNEDGTNLRQIFNDHYHRRGFDVSDDMKELFYLKRKNGETDTEGRSGDSIWFCSAAADGTKEKVLWLFPDSKNFGVRNNIDVSSDKDFLIYSTHSDNVPGNSLRDGDVFKLDLQTFENINLTNDGDFAKGMVSISPDNRQIVYQRSGTPWSAIPYPMYVINSDGSGKRDFSLSGSGNYSNSVYSVSGNKIGYSFLNGGFYDVWIAEADGSNPHRIVSNNGTNLLFGCFNRAGNQCIVSGNKKFSVYDLTGNLIKEIAIPEQVAVTDFEVYLNVHWFDYVAGSNDNSGLVAWYPFNGNTNDESGNGNNGIPEGESKPPVLTSDRFGFPNSAYEFGGYYNKNWIRIPNSPSMKLTNQLSVSVWFCQCSFAGMNGYGAFDPNGYHILFSKAGDGIAAKPGFWSGITTDKNGVLNLYLGNKNAYGYAVNFTGNATINCFDPCEWIHLAVVVNNDRMQMYFNGKLQLDKAIDPAVFTVANGENFFIGRMDQGIWYPFNGKIDDLSFYNKALTQAEVLCLMGDYKSSYSGNNTITFDSIKVQNIKCSEAGKGSIAVYPNPDNAPYKFSLNGGATYQDNGIFSGLNKGKYSIRIKSSCNLIDTTISVSQVVPVEITKSICKGESFRGHNATGTYQETTIVPGGCDTITIRLTVNPIPIVKITPSLITICKGATETLTATGAAFYSWGSNLGNSPSVDVTPGSTATFSVTGTTLGCSNTASSQVKVNLPPVAGFTLNPEIVTLVKPEFQLTDQSSGQLPLSWNWILGGYNHQYCLRLWTRTAAAIV